jgi:non-specific serine/threonine protein kinase
VPDAAGGDSFTFGSGYLIGPGRVLTAAHVLVAPGRDRPAEAGDGCDVLWSFAGDRWTAGAVLWADAELDVAVVGVGTGTDLAPSPCGRLEGDEPLVWSAVGYPVASLDESGRQPEHAWGETSAITQAPAQKLGLTVTSRRPRPSDAGTGWAGLSGAAVLCDGRLVGVVIADPSGYEASLVARRLQAVAGDAALHQALGSVVVLEPVSRRPPDPDTRAMAVLPPPPPPAGPTGPSGRPLPTFTSTFVGRHRELAEATTLLEATALFTVTGVGGVGKTRLAVHLARQVAPTYPDGAWYAELASVREPGLVPQAVASAVGVAEEAGRGLLDVLGDHLQHRRVLLVLDNCEHVFDAAREVAGQLLARCADLRILATSRQPLGVDGETVWPLSPLPVPASGDVGVEELLGVDSVRLFADRATKAGSGFVLTPANAAAVAEICRRLEGIPLAIQLIVPRLRALSVEELAARLSDWFLSGRSGGGGEPSRQRTMYAAVDWSHQMLGDDEKVVFSRLAVFTGGCTLEAAEQVCGAGLDARAVLDVLGRLVDRSLVVADRREGTTRFRLLEPVREYARERLDGSGERGDLGAAHARWFGALASRAEAGIGGAEIVSWLDAVDRDEDNLRGALRFLLGGGVAVAGLRMVADMEPYWFCRARFGEGRSWFEEALAEAADAAPADRARALIRFGNLVRSADHATALTAVEEAVALARSHGDPLLAASALLELAAVCLGLNRSAEARRHYEACIAQARLAGDAGMEAVAVSGLTTLLVDSGDVGAAIATQVEVVAAVQKAGDAWETACAIGLLGHWRTLAGDFDEGLELLHDALARFRAMSSPWGEGWSLCAIAEPALAGGDLDGAAAGFGQALDVLRGRGMDELAGWALAGLGHVDLLRGDLVAARGHFTDMFLCRERVYGSAADAASGFVPHVAVLFAAEGRHELAARLLGGAAAARGRRSFPVQYLKDRAATDRAMASARRALGDDGFSQAWDQGWATPMEVLVVEAREALGQPGETSA